MPGRPSAWRGPTAALAGAAALAVWLIAGAAEAETFHVGGLTFSDALGGFRILDVSGSGTLDDPFVVVEEVTDGNAAILTVSGLSGGYGNRIGSHHLSGFALTKVVINRTATAWSRYEVELREVLENQSPYGDGLSFGQGGTVGRPFLATGFAGNQEIDEPYDSVVFGRGLVRPGEAATLTLVITDTTPASPFYVVQAPMQEVASHGARAQLASTQLNPR